MTNKFPNSGTLGRNKYRKTDAQPEYTGEATINDVEYRLAAWVKEGKDGKFFSIKFSLPQTTEASDVNSSPTIDDDSIPF